MRLLPGSHRNKVTPIPRKGGRSTQVARRTYYGGVSYGVGEVASTVGDGLGEVASTAGDGVGEPASAAGNTALPDIFALSKLRCHWRCKSSGPSCRGAGRACFAGSPAVTFEVWGIRVRSSGGSCCNLLSLFSFRLFGVGSLALNAGRNSPGVRHGFFFFGQRILSFI